MNYEPPPPSDDFGADIFGEQPVATPPPPPMPTMPIPEDVGTEIKPDADAASKRGSARTRHERRKQHAAPKSTSTSTLRQIRVPQRMSIPTLAILRGTRLWIGLIAAVAFVVILVFILGRVRNNAQVTQPNALWLDTKWTYEKHTDDDVKKLVDDLRSRKIGTVYAIVTYLQFDGTWRNEDKYDNVKAFVTQFKAAYPEAQLDGLIGVPVQDATHPDRLSDVNLQQNVANLAKRLTSEFGFQGIFLDAEPVSDGDQDYLSLLRTLRSAVGIDTQISAAIPPDYSPTGTTVPASPLFAAGTEWKKEYKQSVALLVDHMVVLAFNSNLTSAADYAQWVGYQVKAYAFAIDELNANNDLRTDLIIGIPTFDAAPGHDPAVENIDTAVQGVNLGVQQAGNAAKYVKGIAVYADWTTDADEWSDFQKVWSNGQ